MVRVAHLGVKWSKESTGVQTQTKPDVEIFTPLKREIGPRKKKLGLLKRK